MTKRLPVSTTQNVWFDSEQVDNTDLTLEQNYNNTITAGIIGNHIGTGVLPEVLEQKIIFDSSLATGFLDGVAVSAQNQPTDNNYGNQLEVVLSNSLAAGSRAVKVGIIGLDFQNNLQFETFRFQVNETQVGKKHFTKVLVLLFNDLIGDPDLSFNLGGNLVIKEASPMTLSKDPVMVSQDIEPNLFFRDFFLDGSISLQTLLQTALPTYNIDSLGIYTDGKDVKYLNKNDVSTQVGQKFLATTNNIQKITLLLSVRNSEVGQENDLVWNGDLVISIYPLQSNIECPSDIAPELAIDFAPYNIPIAQLSYNYSSLQATGVVLNSVPQPVDFVFSNSAVAGGNVIVPGSYYAFTLKRSGSANKCDLMLTNGSDRVADSRITNFTGTLWVDIPEEDLWFKVWTDAAKISDGQGYDEGHGIIIPKNIIDPTTQVTTDYSLDGIEFVGNDVFRAKVAAITEKSDPVPDQRTGNPVLSKQQFVPQVSLLNSIDIANLELTAEPLLIGAISDKNKKFYDPSLAQIISRLHSATIAEDEVLIRIIDDNTDTGRYDPGVNSLVSNLLNGDLIGAKFIPNSNNVNIYYRLAEARLCSMIVGDVNGDGIVDSDDLDLLNSYLGYNLNVGLPASTDITTDGYTLTYTNGYDTSIVPFSSAFTVNFCLVDPDTNDIFASATDGILVAHPTDPRLAQFTSTTVNFSSITGLSDYKLVILTTSPVNNYGGFDIVSVDTLSDVVTIRKVLLTGDSLAEMLRADINGDFYIDGSDGYLLQSYIERIPLSTSPTLTFPGPSTNAYTKIGTTFNVIRLKVEKFIDRTDDYSSVTNGRPGVVHPIQDIFDNDGYYAEHNFYTNPSILTFNQQLVWDPALVVVNSNPRLVPSNFTTLNGFVEKSCNIIGTSCQQYPLLPDFDPGRTDIFVPNNLIIGNGGELHRPDGDFYKVDFEVGTITLEIPDGLYGSEKTINIMDDFIADYTGTGITRLGFPAMRFADCSVVTSSALANDQLRFSVAVQSFSPNTNGLSDDGYSGVIVDGKMGVSIDYDTGLLTLNFTNLFEDPIISTLSTKLQINVFLKKGGFNNKPLFVDSTKVQNMLKLISVFSGENNGGGSALLDLGNDVQGILPIIHGGTGLNAVGAFGTVLVSNGSSLSYQFVDAEYVSYTPSIPGNWGPVPSTLQEALDQIAAGGGGGGGSAGTLFQVLANGNDADGYRIVDLGNPIAAQDAATKFYVDGYGDNFIKKNGTVAFTGNQSMGSNRLTNMANPVSAQDAATKAYVDAATPAIDLGDVLANGNNADGYKITNLGTPTVASDAATKAYVDGYGDNFIKKDGSVAFTANQSMGSNRLVSVQNPVNPQDAATKAYVDGYIGTNQPTRTVNTQTTDATLTNVVSINMASNTLLYIGVRFVGKQSSSTNILVRDCTAVFRNTAGSAVLVGAIVDGTSFKDDAAWSTNITTSGTNVIPQIQGKAATTINWVTYTWETVVTLP